MKTEELHTHLFTKLIRVTSQDVSRHTEYPQKFCWETHQLRFRLIIVYIILTYYSDNMIVLFSDGLWVLMGKTNDGVSTFGH